MKAPGRVVLSAAFISLVCNAHAYPADDRSGTLNQNCGKYALYYLLRLEGISVTWAALESKLPPGHAEGYSMRDLRDTGSALGLRSDGVFLDGKKFGSIDRPMLLHLKQGRHGHFIAVRPVGHTGKLLQVFDMLDEPTVVDREALMGSRIFSWVALAPRRTGWGWYAGLTALAGAAAGACCVVKKYTGLTFVRSG